MFIVFYDSANERNRVSKFATGTEVLTLVKPEITITAVREVLASGPVEDHEIVFENGRLALKPIPKVRDAAVDVAFNVMQALEAYKWTAPNATASDVYTYIEEQTGWKPNLGLI